MHEVQTNASDWQQPAAFPLTSVNKIYKSAIELISHKTLERKWEQWTYAILLSNASTPQ